MATYYIRQKGNDSNNGTSPATAWRTVGKALNAGTTVVSGDTVYVGAGVYREGLVINPAVAWTTEVKVVGDIDGSQTGDPGEVVLSSFFNGETAAASTGTLLDTTSKGRWAFERFIFIGGNNADSIFNFTTVSNIRFTECLFFSARTAATATLGSATTTHNVASNFTFERCWFWLAGSTGFIYSFPTGTTASWNANIQYNSCVFIGQHGTYAVSGIITGTAAQEGNGIHFNGCTFLGCGIWTSTATRLSLTATSTIRNCLCIASGQIIASGEAGQITDNGCNRFVTANATLSTNFTVISTSRAAVFPTVVPFAFGQSFTIGRLPDPLGTPYAGWPTANYGNASTVLSYDLMNRTRKEGSTILGDSGTASSSAATSLTDSSKAWGVNQWKGFLVRIVTGTGSGQIKRITSNTATVLTIDEAILGSGGSWSTNPDNTSTYSIYLGPLTETGKATAGTTNTLTDTTANWVTNQWSGYAIVITGGTGSGQSALVSSNTATVLTRAANWTTIPDATSIYALYQGNYGTTGPTDAVGALSQHDTALKEVATVDVSPSIVIVGPGSHEFPVRVTAAATTVTVKARYDSLHGTTNKPQAILIANGEIGVATETITMTAAADTWETLTFSSFTPTAAGIVFIRLVSRSADTIGKAFFDTFTVSP